MCSGITLTGQKQGTIGMKSLTANPQVERIRMITSP